MNALADWLFSIMLGWTGTLANSLWNAFNHDTFGRPGFVSHIWLPLALIIMVAGTLIDYAVWLIRWRPIQAWRYRRIHRKLQKANHKTARQMEHGEMEPVYREQIADWVQTQEDPVYQIDQEGAYDPALYEAVYQPSYEMSEPAAFPYSQGSPYEPLPISYDEVVYEPIPDASIYQNPDQRFSQGYEPYFPVHDQIYEAVPFSANDEGYLSDEPLAPGGFAPSDPPVHQEPIKRGQRRSERHASRPREGRLNQFLSKLPLGDVVDEGILNGLPPPVDAHEAFHSPIYPPDHTMNRKD